MIVRFLMVAEIQVDDTEYHTEEAQAKLDAFREASLPNERGISLYRIRPSDVSDEDLFRDGVSIA